MADYRHAALAEIMDGFRHPAAAFQLDRGGAGFLDDAGGIAERHRRAFFISAERHVHRDQGAFGAAHHRLGVGDHHVEGDAQRVLQPMHHHAQTVAHQHDVDVTVEQPRGMGVVAGQAHYGLAALVGADLGHRDAADFILDGHGRRSRGQTI